MTFLKTLTGWWLWLLGLFFGALLPWIANMSSMTVYHKILWVLLIINGLYAAISGRIIGKEGTGAWRLLVFPLVFAVATFLLRDVAHQYAYYLAIGYLCVSYFAYGRQVGLAGEQRGTKQSIVGKKTAV
ncbi:hypothetical protein [Furfurilactobacillus siliginis]|nr:hypothetical protein [Furfurilactobacillus siliginis]GEK27821.1 hypothetical protein LSI01_01320 [Furfurilactobacillus siliginis]